jgi:hypothetical protein
MNDPAEAIRQKLEAVGGIGTYNAATGWCITLGQFHPNNHTCITINGTGGRNPMPHYRINWPSVQIMVRGSPSGYVEARAKIKAVVDALLGMGTTVLNSDTYRSCNQMGDVINLGQDANNRPIFSANFWFIVEPATGTHRLPIT